MSETPKQKPEDLRSPHLTEKEDERLESIMLGGLPHKKAWDILLDEVSPERRQEIEASIKASENQTDVLADAVAATNRIVDEPHPLDVQPEPPKPGETDSEIRHRHNKRLLDVQVKPSTADEQARADEAKEFADRILKETGGLDVQKLLETHPELTDKAKRLGFIE